MFNAIDYAAFIQAITQAKQTVDTTAAKDVELEVIGE